MKAHTKRSQETSLDELQSVDEELRGLLLEARATRAAFERIRQDPEWQHLSPYRYGDAVRHTLRLLAVRQSSAVDVAAAVSAVPSLRPLAAEFVQRGSTCRGLFNELNRVMNCVQTPRTNAVRDVYGLLELLTDLSSATVEWELLEAIPQIRSTVGRVDTRVRFSSAAAVRRHAPTTPNAAAARTEHGRVAARFRAIFGFIGQLQL